MAAARHDVTPYKGHIGLYRIGFVAAIAIFVVSAYIAGQGSAAGWETTWFAIMNGWSDGWYRTAVVITFFGSLLATIFTVAGAFLLRFYRLAWRLALSILSAYPVATLAKEVIGRERPLGLLNGVHVRIAETTLGFPSVHAAVITVIGLTLLPYLPGRWRWLVPIAILLVGWSRLYLGVHLPLDIIGGIALGTIIVALVRILPQSLRVLLRID